MTHRPIIIACLIICFATLAGFSSSRINANNVTTNTQTVSPNTIPDAYIINAEISNFQNDGKLEYRLSTPKLEQFTAQNKITLVSPIINYISNNAYTATAKYGVLSNKQDLLLEDDVVLRKTNSALSLSTQALSINLPQKELTTNTFVTLIAPEGKTTSNGLIAKINEDYFKLTNRVRGVYAP